MGLCCLITPDGSSLLSFPRRPGPPGQAEKGLGVRLLPGTARNKHTEQTDHHSRAPTAKGRIQTGSHEALERGCRVRMSPNT